MAALEPYLTNIEKCQQNRLRLAWCIPRLNAINEKELLLDIVGIIDSGRHFQHKKCPKIEGRIVCQLVIETIKQYLGMKKEKRFTVVYHDMDHIFGRWSEEEFEQIQGKIDSERKVEKELWS